jgi:hypothetical protein
MRKSLRGDGYSGAVQGECVLAGALDSCYWREVWCTTEFHCYTRTGIIKQLRAVCSATLLCSDNIPDWITGDWVMLSVYKHMQAYCLLFVHLLCCCGTNASSMAGRNLSLTAKSCWCVYIKFLAGIFSWCVDCRILGGNEICAQTRVPYVIVIFTLWTKMWTTLSCHSGSVSNLANV